MTTSVSELTVKLPKRGDKLIADLKRKPDAFHGLGGYLLLTTLDDASRNAALCSSSGMGDALTQLLDGKLDKAAAASILHITQACQDSSVQLNTVSENVNALMERELIGQQILNHEMNQVLNQCGDILKRNRPKPTK